ncbi:hypothetical protein Micbo1qcDRAFT_177499 [Microdochium bolleyi]|uniref:Uncharacterized protein n=1 Tax=Microdochium bolleyi TaxID=196109 RepID=A0A136IVJ0_9PEZI|nr:hypothetical protein Micbo1qcDRAFT_177499 [Microdochium bolleyi]
MRTVSEDSNDGTSQPAKRLAFRRRKAPGRPAGYRDNASTPQQTAAESPGMVLAVEHDGFYSSSDMSFFGGSPLDLILDPASIANRDQINDFSAIGLPSNYTTTSDLTDSFFAGSSATTDSSSSWPSITTTPAKSQLPPAQTSPSERRKSSSCEPGLQLSKLHQELTSHLAQIRSEPWDILATLRLESSPCLACHQPTTDPFLESAFDPLASTFRLMSEFEHHITTDSAAAATAGHYGPQMTLSYALTAVSCYIQLVLIYDHVLSHLAEQCADNRIVRDFILRSAAPLSLSGQALPPSRNLLGRSLVRLLESRIGSIEAVLGLPDEFRVSRADERGSRSTVISDPTLGEDVGGDASVDDGRECKGLVGKSLLGVLQASLLTSESGAGGPAIVENLRTRMTYLEKLA